MTQPTHDEVIAWIDKEIAIQRQYLDSSFYLSKKPHEIQLSAWLAIRDVLERHKSTLDGVCMGCSDFTRFSKGLGAPHKVMFPCPTYQDIYNRIREVM